MPKVNKIRKEFEEYYNNCLLMGFTDEAGCVVIDGYRVRKVRNDVELISITKDIYKHLINGEVVIPEYINIIGKSAFQFSDITFVRLPKWVKKIKTSAFSYCVFLKTVIIEGNVKEIAPETFKGCSVLNTVILPPTIQIIRHSAFENCKRLEKIEGLSDNLREIAYKAFYNCANLQSIFLPDTLETIGESAFRNSGIEEIKLPNGIEVLPRALLAGCKNLSELIIPEGVKVIDEFAVYGCRNLKHVEFPNSLTRINGAAFNSCHSIEAIESLGNIESIGFEAFYNCSSLRRVCLPEGLKVVGEGAFEKCLALNSVRVPTTVIKIGARAFKTANVDPLILMAEEIDIFGDSFGAGCPRIYCPNFKFGCIFRGEVYKQEPSADVIQEWKDKGK